MAYYLEAYLVGEDFGESLEMAEVSGPEVRIPIYDAVRQVLRPEYRNLSDADLQILLQQVLGGMSPEEIEGFWDTLKDVGKAALGVVKQAAPVILPAAGAALGTFIGGPVGTAIGSKLGQMGAQLIAPQKPGAPPAAPPPAVAPAAPAAAAPAAAAPTPPAAAAEAPPTAATPAQPAAATAAQPAAAPVPSGGTSAAAQLTALLKNPDLLKSLLGKLLGGAGESTVLVGPRATPVPFGAMMNALESLAAQAALEAAEAYDYDTEARPPCPRYCYRRNLPAKVRAQYCRRCIPVAVRYVPPRRPVVVTTAPPMPAPGEIPPAYGEEPYGGEPYGGEPYGQEPYGEEPYGGEESFEAMRYLQDGSGNFVVDPANPDERAQRVLELLNEAAESYVPEPYDPVTEWLIEAELL